MRKRIKVPMCVVAVVSAAMLGCSDTPPRFVAPEPRSVPKKPLFNMTPDCQLTTAQCAMIDSAITVLETHEDGNCVALGMYARLRFLSVTAGYKQGDEVTGQLGYVEMVPDNNAQWGYSPVDGTVHINPTQSSNYGRWNLSSTGLPRTIGHEEFHQWGWPPTHSDFGPPPPPCALLQ